MPAANYYIFNDSLEDADLGFQHSEVWKLPRIRRVTWVWGERHAKEIPIPIEVELNPEFGTELIDCYHEHIPIWSNRLIEALRQVGVDNLDVYDAIVRDPRTGLETADYKAVNVIGRADCVDMQLSQYDPRSEMGAREFTKLVIDPKRAPGLKVFRLIERPTIIVIHGDVKRAIEAAHIIGVRADPVELSPMREKKGS